MEDAVAMGAVRRLSVDLANVAGQLAITQASLELIQGAAQGIAPDSWDKTMDESEGKPEMLMTLRGEQVDGVMRLLAAVQAIR